MKLGFIGGTGNLGYGLAVRCAINGHEIMIGSRDEEKATHAAQSIREAVPAANVTGGTNAVVAEAMDILILSLPFAALEGTLPGLACMAEGKIVLDTTVPMQYGKPPVYTAPAEGSAAQLAERLLPGSRIVSGFHSVSAASLAGLSKQLDCDALVCGNDEEAKQLIMSIMQEFIPRVFNAGPLFNAQTLERITPLVIAMNQIYKKRHIGIKVSGIE